MSREHAAPDFENTSGCWYGKSDAKPLSHRSLSTTYMRVCVCVCAIELTCIRDCVLQKYVAPRHRQVILIAPSRRLSLVRLQRAIRILLHVSRSFWYLCAHLYYGIGQPWIDAHCVRVHWQMSFKTLALRISLCQEKSWQKKRTL